jgi:hypothetical protein
MTGKHRAHCSLIASLDHIPLQVQRLWISKK